MMRNAAEIIIEFHFLLERVHLKYSHDWQLITSQEAILNASWLVNHLLFLKKLLNDLIIEAFSVNLSEFRNVFWIFDADQWTTE